MFGVSKEAEKYSDTRLLFAVTVHLTFVFSTFFYTLPKLGVLCFHFFTSLMIDYIKAVCFRLLSEVFAFLLPLLYILLFAGFACFLSRSMNMSLGYFQVYKKYQTHFPFC